MLNDCNSEIYIDNIETFEFNEVLLNNDNIKIISNYENKAESVTNHTNNIIPDDDINKSFLEYNNTQNNKNIINVVNELIQTPVLEMMQNVKECEKRPI